MAKIMIRMVVVVMCIVPIMMYGAKVGVLHLKSVGVSPETAEAVAGLLANELSNLGHRVLNTDAMDGVAGEVIQCYEANCAAELGFKAQVERVIFGSVSRFGEKYMVQVSVVNVSTREVVWSGSLAAKSAEDLDTAVKRIAKAIHEGKKVEEGAEVGMITEHEETAEIRRKQSFTTVGLKLGMTFPFHGYGGTGSMVIPLWLIGWYETPNFVVELGVLEGFSGNLSDVSGGKSTEAMAPMISVYYLFSKGDFSPFAGGGAGLGMLNFYDPSGVSYGMGFAYALETNIGGGLVMFRSYDFRIVIGVDYVFNFAEIPGFEGPHHGIRFGIGFTYRTKRGGCCGLGGGGGCF